MQQNWDVFFPDVLPEVPGCPEPTVERALLRAAREWCERTLCWRADLDAITTRDGIAGYDFRFPIDAELVKVIDASVNDQTAGLEGAYVTSAVDRRAGTQGSSRILVNDKHSFVVMPTPAEDLAIVITAVLQPSDGATGVPTVLADYRQHIAKGALAELLAMARAEWKDDKRAEQCAGQFQTALNKTKIAIWRALSNARPRTTGMYF